MPCFSQNHTSRIPPVSLSITVTDSQMVQCTLRMAKSAFNKMDEQGFKVESHAIQQLLKMLL